MKTTKAVHWLHGQLPDWVAAGIISEVQAEQLRERHPLPDSSARLSAVNLIAGTLSALLVGGGIILIVAYNWDDFSKVTRTVISFLPLLLGQVIYGYAFFRKAESPGWIEGGAGFLMLMLAASLALVSQTYHIAGRPEQFLWLWLWLSVPLVYLRRANLPALIFLAAAFAWSLQSPFPYRTGYYLLMLAILPHLYFGLKPDAPAWGRNTLGWAAALTFFSAWFWVTPSHLPEYGILGPALLAAILLLAGRRIYDTDDSLWRRPWTSCSYAIAFGLLLILTFDLNLPGWDWETLRYGGGRISATAASLHLGVLVAAALSYALLMIRWRETILLHEFFLLGLPIFTLIYLVAVRSGADTTALVLTNLYVLAWGAAYLHRGLQQQRMPSVNLGMFLILALATTRFFDTGWSPLVKGIAFVLLGLLFLGSRYWLGRKMA